MKRLSPIVPVIILLAVFVLSIFFVSVPRKDFPSETAIRGQGRVLEEAESSSRSLWYTNSYINFSIVGKIAAASNDADDFCLVAGSHSAGFIFPDTEPWDNGLLYIAGEGFHFTDREQGRSLHLNVNTEAEQDGTQSGGLRYEGDMTRATTGEPVSIAIALNFDYVSTKTYFHGIPWWFPFKSLLPFFRYRPFPILQGSATVKISEGSTESVYEIQNVAGLFDWGSMRWTTIEAASISYSFVAVALTEGDGSGFTFVDLVSEPLNKNPDGLFGWLVQLLFWVFKPKETLTMIVQDGQVDVLEENYLSIDRPPADDLDTVVFHRVVDLGRTTLRRQMIRVPYAGGLQLYGLHGVVEKLP